MMTILCATRGGEASIKTQERAIALAQERNTDIAFLYVTDVQFLNHVGAAIVVDVAKELQKMGEFLLLMAKERAEKAGIEATTLVKQGVFRQALIASAQEVEAELVVLGSPADDNITMKTLLDAIAAEVKDKAGIETVIV